MKPTEQHSQPPESQPVEQYSKWIAEARSELEQTRDLLLRPTPESIDACAPHWRAAIERLESLRLAPRRLGAELGELRRELTHVMTLLENASAFCLGWAQRLAAATTGYTADGLATPWASAPRTLYIEI